MPPMYRIRDWDKHFENNRTRDLKELRFVILPNKHDGDGYTELLDHPNGAAHYGAWVAIVQVASKCDPRGTLLRQSRTPLRDSAEAHNSASLARITRIPKDVFEEAIPRLVQIGWLEAERTSAHEEVVPIHIDSESPQQGAVLRTAQSRTPLRKSAPEWNGIEGNGKEEKGIQNTLVAQARRVFDFWKSHLDHPNSRFDNKRERAITARLKEGYTVEELEAAVRGCKLTPHNMGQNERNQVFDDVELICRDAAHVDRFIANSKKNGNGFQSRGIGGPELEAMLNG